jgi:hypothetical protein
MLVGIALLDLNYHQWASLHHVEPAYSFDLLELLTVPIPLHQQILIFWLMFLVGRDGAGPGRDSVWRDHGVDSTGFSPPVGL